MSSNIDKDKINYDNSAFVPGLLQVGNASYIVIPSDKEQLNVLGISSLSPSERVVEKTGISASAPYLSQPEFYATNLNNLTRIGLSTGGLDGVSEDGRLIVINLAAFTFSLENRYHEIIISILDKWIESIQEDEKRLREQLLCPSYLNWLDERDSDFFEMQDITRMSASEYKRYLLDTSLFSQWVDSLPPELRIAELNKGNRYQILAGMETAISDYRENLQSNGPSVTAPFVMASLAIGSSFLGDYVRVINGGVSTSPNPIVSAVTQMGKPLIEGNLAALGYFGSLFGVGVVYQTSDQVALSVGQVSDKQVSVKFAREYGNNMMRLLDSTDFNLFLNASVVNLSRGGKPISERERKEMVDAMKFVLLTTSLAIIYKSETGKITDMEIGAMLTGEMPVNDDPVKMRLKERILSALSGLDKLQQPMINATLEYLNRDPNFNELFDVYRIFEGIRQTEELSEEVHFKGQSA